MTMRDFDTAEVKAMREKTGLGLQDCKRIIKGRIVREAIAEATTVEQLRLILAVMVDDIYPQGLR